MCDGLAMRNSSNGGEFGGWEGGIGSLLRASGDFLGVDDGADRWDLHSEM